MKMPVYDNDRQSRHVGFAEEPLYSRRPRSDEEYVMDHFNEHASRCSDCSDPYSTHLSGKSLCEKGHKLAQDVARYVYSKGGRAYSMLDRASLRQRVQVEIPPHCDRVRGLLRAVDHGLRVQKPEPAKSYDKNYYVPVRPKRQSFQENYASGGPVKEPIRVREAEGRYIDGQRLGYELPNSYANKRRSYERRQSVPASSRPYIPSWDGLTKEKPKRSTYYDDKPFYYYRPSKKGPEQRIPRSESPARETIRRRITDDYYASKYVSPPTYRPSRYEYPESRRSSRYDSPEAYYSSGRSSPSSYDSSRRGSAESYRSSHRSSPDLYPKNKDLWSAKRMYRDLVS